MTKTRLYIIRHGKTMFNTIRRAQGWSDSPLTEQGAEGIHQLGKGLKRAGIEFQCAYSSDSGRAIQTADILLRELGLKGHISHEFDERIREWCFGSFDGAYSGELFYGVIPRVLDIEDYKKITLKELADGLVTVDTANWAEPWEKLSQRIWDGFESIAKEVEASGGGNALVVSHNMTIGTFAGLVDPSIRLNPSVENGSVTIVEYENGEFTILSLGDVRYLNSGE